MSKVHIPTLPVIYVNGELQSTVSTVDRGLAYGDGVFETLMIARGEIPLWSYHHARLLKGLLHLQINLESQRLRQDIDTALEMAKKIADDLLVLKIIVTRGQGGRGYQTDPDASATLIVQLFPVAVDLSKHNGVNVHICEQKLSPVSWAGLKTLNQLPYILATQERSGTNFDEGLLLSTTGNLIEGTARNIFIVDKEKLYTPALDECGVAGVQRQLIMEKVATQLEIEVSQKVLATDDLFAADEVFLANSVTGIWPVTQCEENHTWKVGPITRSLQAMCHGLFLA